MTRRAATIIGHSKRRWIRSLRSSIRGQIRRGTLGSRPQRASVVVSARKPMPKTPRRVSEVSRSLRTYADLCVKVRA
jgi:hypothetical protein